MLSLLVTPSIWQESLSLATLIIHSFIHSFILFIIARQHAMPAERDIFLQFRPSVSLPFVSVCPSNAGTVSKRMEWTCRRTF